MPFFSQHGVWHSYLKASSPLVVKFKNPPTLSKYPDKEGNDQWIIYFQVRGDDPGTDYYYRIENDELLEKLRNVEYGQWLSLTAGGGPGDQHITLEPASGDAGNAPRSSSGGGGQQSNEDSFSTGYIVGDYMRCIEEAKGVAKEIGAQDPAITQSIAATLYINWSHARFRVPLSADDAPEREYTDEESDVDQSAEVHGLIDQLPKRTGKAHDGKALKTAIGNIEKAIDGESMVDAEVYGQVIKWLSAEIEHQTPEEEADYSDDLPF